MIAVRSTSFDRGSRGSSQLSEEAHFRLSVVRNSARAEARGSLCAFRNSPPEPRCHGRAGVRESRFRRGGVWFGIALSTCAASVLSACAKPAGSFFNQCEQRLVWPPAPEKPRVEYLGEFSGAIRAPGDRSAGKAWREFLYGPDHPPSLVTPHAVSVDATGNLLAVADPNSHCMHLFNLERQTYRRIAGTGRADTTLVCPVGAAWAGDDLFVIDSELPAIIRIEHAATIDKKQDKVAGERLATDAGFTLQRPAGIAFNASNEQLYITDAGAHCVWSISRSGSLVRSFGERGAGDGQFNYPSQIAIAPDGSVVVADSMNFRVQRFSAEGEFLGTFGQKGDASGDFALPKGVAVDEGGRIWVVDAQFENVQAFTPDGGLLLAFGEEGHRPGQFWLPAGAAIDSRRRLWIADTYNRRVQGFQLLP